MSGAGPSGDRSRRGRNGHPSPAESDSSLEARSPSPVTSNNSPRNEFSRFLPQVAKMSAQAQNRDNGRGSGRARGRGRKAQSERGSRPVDPEPQDMMIDITEDAWSKIRLIIQEELQEMITHVFAQKLAEAIPQIEEISQSEARLLDSEVQAMVVDRMNSRFEEMCRSQEQSQNDLRTYTNDVVRQETSVYTARIGELEKTFSDLRLSQSTRRPVESPHPKGSLPIATKDDNNASRHSRKTSGRSDEKKRSSRGRKKTSSRRASTLSND